MLKQALLKRGVPSKLVVDNGAAYRAQTLQGICARLGIHLIFCRPYAPEGKGKLERWHRTLRDQFLGELDERHITSLEDLNARLWAWLEQVYHRSARRRAAYALGSVSARPAASAAWVRRPPSWMRCSTTGSPAW